MKKVTPPAKKAAPQVKPSVTLPDVSGNTVVQSQAGESVLSGGVASGTLPSFTGIAGTGPTGGNGLTKAEQIKQYTTETQSADFTTVQYVANQVYQSLMGRNATGDEITSLFNQFNTYAKNNPIYTRTAQYEVGGTGPSSAFTAGYAPTKDITQQKNVLSVNDFITALTQNTPEAEAFGAAKNYMGAIKDYLAQYRSSI